MARVQALDPRVSLSRQLLPASQLLIDQGNLLMTGQIPRLTRSIGLDPDGTIVYFASPDSNSIVVVPLPNPPVQDPSEIHLLA